MEIKELIWNIGMNICLLSVIASALSKLKFVQNLILQEKRSLKSDMILSCIFGGIITIATACGSMVGDYNMNTKVIAALAAGLLGGPLVGIYSSLLGCIYVYFGSPDPAFALTSAYSLLLVGMLGGGFYPYFQRGKWKYRDLFVLTCFAEIVELICLLRSSVPVLEILDMILNVSIPMIVLNSLGMLVFISSFNTVFVYRELESTKQLQRASILAKKSLPLLRDGLHNQKNVEMMATVIMEETDWMGVMITDERKVLEWQQKNMKFQPNDMKQKTKEEFFLPEVAKEAMKRGKMSTLYSVPKEDSWYDWIGEYSVLAEPFMIKDRAVGCLLVWVKKQFVFHQSDIELLHNFGMLASSQLAMEKLEKQEQMRQKAEFRALQFQVNPHFLFNALNTISSVCRENSGRARELLLTLADYFRYNLGNGTYMVPLQEEIEHVQDYLEIEKARFEENLVVTYELAKDMHILIPTLILQPIVENAVRHGRGQDGKRIVHISVWNEPDGYRVQVKDQGPGFDQEVLDKLYAGEDLGKSIGLSNVHKRMKSIYGEENGLRIENQKDGGSCVTMYFMKGTIEGKWR